jgi:multisubunit Na+/H+ antiporter MnhC subunit
VPAVIPAPAGTKAKSPNTVAPAEVPYKIDPQAGLKPLEESDRAKGYWYQQAGIGMIRLGSLGVFGTTLQGGAQTLQGDPVLSNLVLTGVVVGGIAVTGYIVKVYGDWRRKRGEKAATQGLY